MSEPLLTIYNRHAATCGDPPIVSSAGNRSTCVGYFENVHGEQWIFTFDRVAGVGLLRSGDIGWNTLLSVECNADGEIRTKPRQVILNAEEQHWLLACWRAATAGGM
jgi:hypothetical protein